MPKCQCREFPNGVLHAGRNYKVLRSVVLKHQPHAFDVVFCITPVAFAVQIAKVQFLLQTARDPGGGKRNLSRYEGLSAPFRFMIEQNAVYRKHVICFTVLLHNPKTVLFRNSIGTVGMERCGFPLWNLLDTTV
ncbi:hypothetical protein SDC9_115465 [bioreactor metagenome]|uniref:Uncharacterized protein n=1 Tax=bioreactor metagenome TaxID=1076179 RepID=A0A645BTG5_9ZZZZ